MRRSFTFCSLALAASLFSAPALAQRPPDASSAGRLEAAPAIAPLRVEPDVAYGAPPSSRRAAWDRFVRAVGSSGGSSRGWRALWDRETRAPLRVFGPGIPAPGAVADPAVAEARALAFLDAHRDLIAPGTAPDHLRLAANDLDRGLRTVAFVQHVPVDGVGLVPVAGGRFSVRFKNDRLFVFGAETFSPARFPAPQIDGAAATLAATAWIAPAHATAIPAEAPALVALPLVGSGRVDLRLAHRVVLDATAPRARWAVYVDARSGEPLAREQLLRFDQATIAFDAPVRAPQLGRTTFPARALDLEIVGAPATTDDTGSFSWAGDGTPVDVDVGARGPAVRVSNQAGINATGTLSATTGSSLVWSLADIEFGDAQLSAFIHGTIIKDHARGIAPDMAFLDATLDVRPNEDDPLGCNAFWDGSSLNFYRENGMCSNTARVADVVYHEFGHGFHQHSIIFGAGALDGALGEAAGDTMAVSKTHDPKMAVGFYLANDAPLRDLEDLRRWPEDISGDPHETGIIWGGAMWDLRTYLDADLGQDTGDAVTDQLFYAALRRSANIPATYVEILAADDDDGDLSNGTPHVCAINRAFLRHGLADVLNEAGLVFDHTPLTDVLPGEGPYPVLVTGTLLYPQCDGKVEADGLTLSAHVLGAGPATGPLSADGDGWTGALPPAPDGTSMRYSIQINAAGNLTYLPANEADPEYRVFVGDTVTIYENDFESQIDGWTFAGDVKKAAGDFEWGEPQGLAGDPAAAFSGKKVIGDKLSGDGKYGYGATSSAQSPLIDVGAEAHPRLQFRRWLSVYDAATDQATIYVNGQAVWQNATSNSMNSPLDHRDAEWRFEDIDLSPFVKPGATTVEVRFELSSDKLGQLGGWNIDDFRIVAWHPRPLVVDAGADAAAPDGGAMEPDPPGGCGCAVPGGDGPGAPVLATLVAITGISALRRRRGSARRPSTG